jgi:hypothetical protein
VWSKDAAQERTRGENPQYSLLEPVSKFSFSQTIDENSNWVGRAKRDPALALWQLNSDFHGGSESPRWHGSLLQFLGDINSERTFTKRTTINGHKLALLSIFLQTDEE